MTRIEKADEAIKKAVEWKKELLRKEKEKEKEKAEAKKRYYKLGKIVETKVAKITEVAKITDFDEFAKYVEKYAFAIAATQNKKEKQVLTSSSAPDDVTGAADRE